jgi:hypothetical protein
MVGVLTEGALVMKHETSSAALAGMRHDSMWLLLALWSCTHSGVPEVTAANATPVPGLTVTLRWTAPVDLDLYVTDPAFETVYFANPRTASGGRLERDARCAEEGPEERVERARWTTPPPGRYRVGVDFLEACRGRGEEAEYVLLVEVDGRRQEIAGRARLAERAPRVLEFSVDGGGSGS